MRGGLLVVGNDHLVVVDVLDDEIDVVETVRRSLAASRADVAGPVVGVVDHLPATGFLQMAGEIERTKDVVYIDTGLLQQYRQRDGAAVGRIDFMIVVVE